jgi:dethiobiotin synthetase
VIVAPNRIGVINQVLQTLSVAQSYRGGLPIAGMVLNDAEPASDDPSRDHNYRELVRLCSSPILSHVLLGNREFTPFCDWWQIANQDPG